MYQIQWDLVLQGLITSYYIFMYQNEIHLPVQPHLHHLLPERYQTKQHKAKPFNTHLHYNVPNPNKKYAIKLPEILKGRENLCHLRVFWVRICHNNNRSNNTYKNSQNSNQTNRSMTRKGTGTILMNKTSLYRPCHHQIDPPNIDQRSHIYHKFHASFHLTIFCELDWFFWTARKKQIKVILHL